MPELNSGSVDFAYPYKSMPSRKIVDAIKAIRPQFDDAEAHNPRGIPYDKQGKVDLAIVDYNQRIKTQSL